MDDKPNPLRSPCPSRQAQQQSEARFKAGRGEGGTFSRFLRLKQELAGYYKESDVMRRERKRKRREEPEVEDNREKGERG
jgi:hypothetical protein